MSQSFTKSMKDLQYSWKQVSSCECFISPRLKLDLVYSQIDWKGPGTIPGHFENQRELQDLKCFENKGATPSFQEQVSEELTEILSAFLVNNLTRRQIRQLVQKLSTQA